ncbi:MAG: hypothetical protein IJD39_10960 [Clostridia bacterium]|nr:hypothetical protein [Clostridia bacterium]
MDLKELSEIVYMNKLEKHFNVTDIPMEICYLHGEVSEIWDAYIRKKGSVGEEMADVMIYLLGLSKILNVDLEKELMQKIEKNRRRVYQMQDGVNRRISEE